MLFCILFAHCFFETLQDLILKKMAATSFSGLEGQRDEHNSGKGPFFYIKDTFFLFYSFRKLFMLYSIKLG